LAGDAGAALLGQKTANVLNKLPKSQQPKAKRALQDIWRAETRKDAEAAFDAFIAAYQLNREALLAFYDFPAEYWKHLRTSNPIESTFATVRHRTIRTKRCLSNTTALAMVFKLIEAAQKSWRRLDGHNQLPKVVPRRAGGRNRQSPAQSRRLTPTAVTGCA
jgi:transposase-like protein